MGSGFPLWFATTTHLNNTTTLFVLLFLVLLLLVSHHDRFMPCPTFTTTRSLTILILRMRFKPQKLNCSAMVPCRRHLLFLILRQLLDDFVLIYVTGTTTTTTTTITTILCYCTFCGFYLVSEQGMRIAGFTVQAIICSLVVLPPPPSSPHLQHFT
jgi:hypothetical protein